MDIETPRNRPLYCRFLSLWPFEVWIEKRDSVQGRRWLDAGAPRWRDVAVYVGRWRVEVSLTRDRTVRQLLSRHLQRLARIAG